MAAALPAVDLGALLAAATASLGGSGEARVDAEMLASHVLGRSRTWLVAHPEHVPTAAEQGRFEEAIAARRKGTPVAYLLGRRGFWTLELEVGPAVLIPRPETELLVELALARLDLDARPEIADLGTGSGAIALALASERPRARVLATDVSDAALALARRNASRLGLERVEFAGGDWCAALGMRRFTLIASNPPYIEEGDAHLRQGDVAHEPRMALASGADGLDAIRVIVRDAPAHLDPGGWLLLEHGWQQGAAVRRLLAARGFSEVASARDLAGHERVTLGRWPPGD